LTRPHGVIPVKYGGASVPAPMIQAVWGFFVAYIFCLVLLASGLSALGLDFPAALTAATSGLSNTGPVLGAVGGHGANYAALPDGAKWLLALGMLIGRLELLTLLVLLSPIFWRR
jgi:trk system potassium uptake protein TrkH